MDSSRSDFPTLSARVEQLEGENRWLKRLGAIVLVALGAVIAMGQAPAKRTVVADEFDLKDSAGIVRATLGFVRDEPTLTFVDANGRERANLGAESIDFKDSNGTERVLLGSSTAISYRLVEGKAQVIDQGPGLLFSGADKKGLVDLRGMSQQALLTLFGQTNSGSGEQVSLASGVDAPSFTLTDAQGFRTVVGSVSLKAPTAGLSSKTSAASVVLFDKSGKSIWSAP